MAARHLDDVAGPPILDEELYMRIYVGSNTDDDVSIWEVLAIGLSQ